MVAGRGVTGDASAALLNVTAVSPDGSGYLTVYPCGQARPNASNVNYVGGAVVPNAVLAKIGVGGKVCVYSQLATDLVIDVNGYVPVGASPLPVVPALLLDSRSGFDTVDGQFAGSGRVGADGVVESWLPVVV